MKSDRAVSEVLGYVLVIGLITTMIAVVMVLGVGGLENSQEAEQINNMERAFDVLDHNVDSLVEGEAPSRATELRLVDDSITYGETVVINVTVGDEPIDEVEIATEPIVYDADRGTQIVYESGSVMRSEPSGSATMLSGPPLVLAEDRVFVHGIRTRPLSGSMETIDDSGTALVRKERLSPDVGKATIPTDETITITVSSPRAIAWDRYFEDVEVGSIVEGSDEGTPNEVIFEIDENELDTDTVTIVQSRVRVTFVR